MNYKDEEREDKQYKKGYNKKEFKKDVTDAVNAGTKPAAPEKEKTMKTNPKMVKGAYSDWKVSDLRKHLNDKKKAYLVRGGFPDGKIPRSKAQMISLCKKLKRKRW